MKVVPNALDRTARARQCGAEFSTPTIRSEIEKRRKMRSVIRPLRIRRLIKIIILAERIGVGSVAVIPRNLLTVRRMVFALQDLKKVGMEKIWSDARKMSAGIIAELFKLRRRKRPISGKKVEVISIILLGRKRRIIVVIRTTRRERGKFHNKSRL